MARYNTDGLMRWAASAGWRAAFDETLALHMGAANEFDLDREELVAILGDYLDTLFAWAFEDLAVERPETGPNFVDDYLKRRGWKESPGTRAYLAALRDSQMSIYEISDIVPGVSFKARDLVRGDGEPVVVFEATGTRMMRPWDRFALRLVEVNGKTMMTGAALQLTREACERALSDLATVRQKLGKGADHDPELASALAAFLLHGGAAIVSAAWLRDLLERLIGDKHPVFANIDGDPLEIVVVRYGVRPGVTHDQLRAALNGLPELRDDDPYEWQWVIQTGGTSESGDAATAREESGARGFAHESIFANLELDGRNLLVTVNSRKRAETAIERLAAPLSGLVGEPSLEAEEEDASTTGPTKAFDPQELSDEVRAAFTEMMDRHYRETLDEPVPFIGGETPRNAVKTEEGRRKVVDWLKFLENATARQRDLGTPYDLEWMWDELGLRDYRN